MSIYITDGGREAAGFKPGNDCAVRALAIAAGMNYGDARKMLRAFCKAGRAGTGNLTRGVFKEDMNAALKDLGWEWHSAPKLEGRKARYSDIEGLAILRMAKHFSVVKNGVLHDTWDSRSKMVYGYWKKTGN